jgi:TetR/AcrR family transcriptional regulator, lmrAB and yxaGH operons repressor
MNQQIDSRNRILKAASRLFQLQGYHATGMNQIIKESGSPKGSLYYYFPDGKEELAIASIKRIDELTREKTKTGLAKSSDPIEAIQSFIREIPVLIEQDQQNEVIPCSISMIALETSSISEPIRNACQQAFEAWGNLFAEKLIQGGFRKERAEELGVIIQLMIEGALIRSMTKNDMTSLYSVAKEIPYILRK